MPADQPDPLALADMRIEVVKRELNQGALAGFGSEITDYAARLVLAALDSFDEEALKAEFRRGFELGDHNAALLHEQGIAEGRRQATEGMERQWAVRFADPVGLQVGYDEADAREAALVTRVGKSAFAVAESRLVGPWEPVEQPETDLPAEHMSAESVASIMAVVDAPHRPGLEAEFTEEADRG